jgi:hypothetical protein
MNWDDFCIEFDADGHLLTTGWHGWREPICKACGKPIPWVLDMMTFSTTENGRHYAQHAACAWTPEAFDAQKRRAEALQRDDVA